jgi:hypothetical protein
LASYSISAYSYRFIRTPFVYLFLPFTRRARKLCRVGQNLGGTIGFRNTLPARKGSLTTMARKTSKSASKDVESAMRKRKKGTLKSGSGRKVKRQEAGDRDRAVGGAKQGQEGRQEACKKVAQEVREEIEPEEVQLASPLPLWKRGGPSRQRRVGRGVRARATVPEIKDRLFTNPSRA